MKKLQTFCDSCSQVIPAKDAQIMLAGPMLKRRPIPDPLKMSPDSYVDDVVLGSRDGESHFHLKCAHEILSSGLLPGIVLGLPLVPEELVIEVMKQPGTMPESFNHWSPPVDVMELPAHDVEWDMGKALDGPEGFREPPLVDSPEA